MKLIDWRRQQVKALLEQGQDLGTIAQQLRFPLSVIEADVRRLDAQTPADKAKARIEQRQAEVSRLAGVMTVGEMATQLGVTTMTIYNDLKIMGLTELSANRAKAEQRQRQAEVARLAGSMTAEEIATRLDVTSVTIYSDLKSLGLVAKKPDKVTAKVKQRQAEVARLAASMSMEEVAAQLGVNIKTIYNDLKFLGLSPKRSRRPPRGTAARRNAVAALAQTMSVRDLALAFGRSQTTIANDLKALSLVDVRRPRGRPRKSSPVETVTS